MEIPKYFSLFIPKTSTLLNELTKNAVFLKVLVSVFHHKFSYFPPKKKTFPITLLRFPSLIISFAGFYYYCIHYVTLFVSSCNKKVLKTFIYNCH